MQQISQFSVIINYIFICLSTYVPINNENYSSGTHLCTQVLVFEYYFLLKEFDPSWKIWLNPSLKEKDAQWSWNTFTQQTAKGNINRLRNKLEEATTDYRWEKLSFNNDKNCNRLKYIKHTKIHEFIMIKKLICLFFEDNREWIYYFANWINDTNKSSTWLIWTV